MVGVKISINVLELVKTEKGEKVLKDFIKIVYDDSIDTFLEIYEINA